MDEVYQLVVPIYRAQRSHVELEKVHRKVADCYKELVHRGQHRFLGSYFRVGFYGILFGDLDEQEYIYKEAALTRLGEFSLRLQVRPPQEGSVVAVRCRQYWFSTFGLAMIPFHF